MASMTERGIVLLNSKCRKCDESITPDKKFVMCCGDDVEYCYECFQRGDVCDYDCTECVEFLNEHPMCDVCCKELTQDENMGSCMCGENDWICQECGTWSEDNAEWLCGKDKCV